MPQKNTHTSKEGESRGGSRGSGGRSKENTVIKCGRVHAPACRLPLQRGRRFVAQIFFIELSLIKLPEEGQVGGGDKGVMKLMRDAFT